MASSEPGCIRPIFLVMDLREIELPFIPSMRIAKTIQRVHELLDENPNYQVFEMHTRSAPKRRHDIEQQYENQRNGGFNNPIDLGGALGCLGHMM